MTPEQIILGPQDLYLATSIVLLLLFILSFLLRKDSNSYTHKFHSFPAVGITSFIGGFLFMGFYIYDARGGFILPIITALCFVLFGIWLCARIIYPAPKAKKKKGKNFGAKTVAIEDLELVDMTGVND